jgi:hypothetical protein
VKALRAGLRELGYVEGNNIFNVTRWAKLSREGSSTPPTATADAGTQYRALPGVRGKGMASRTLERPVT